MKTAQRSGAGKARKGALICCGFRLRALPGGRYVLHVRRAGLRLYETFDTVDAARLKCHQLHQERVQEGLSAFELTKADRIDAHAAKQILGGRTTMAEAARHWIAQHPMDGGLTLEELAQEWLKDLTRRNCRPSTLAGNKRRVARLLRDLGERRANAITAGDARQWLDVRGGKAVNRDNFRRCFRAMFNFAIRRGLASVNPYDAIERTKADEKMPEHWSPQVVESVLRAALDFRPQLVPVLAVMAFAGLRPDEARGLCWENVNLKAGTIRVLPQTSKIRRSRIVDISENLALWLVPHRRERGHLAPPPMTLRRWRERVAAAALLGADEVRRRLNAHEGKKGVTIKKEGLSWSAIVSAAKKSARPGQLWPPDVLRHTYATFWLAEHNDIARLANLMGNSTDMIYRHYRGVVTPEEAKSYWAIVPNREGTILSIASAS